VDDELAALKRKMQIGAAEEEVTVRRLVASCIPQTRLRTADAAVAL
jgi:hypothetical protein